MELGIHHVFVTDFYSADVIGSVVAFGDLKTVVEDNEVKQNMYLKLEDSDGLTIQCILVDDFALQFSTYVTRLEEKGKCNIILILQLAKICVLEGIPVITTSSLCTKMFINADFKGIIAFRDSIILRIATVSPIERSSQISCCAPFLNFVGLYERKFVSQMTLIYKVSTCIMVGTIVSIPKSQIWYYLACLCCKEPIKLESSYTDFAHLMEGARDNKLWSCPNCLIIGAPVVLRFKVQVKVEDETGVTPLVLYDNQILSFLNKTANELCEISEDGYVDDFLKELNKLIGKEFIFKIKVSNLNLLHDHELYTVLEISDDKDLIYNYGRDTPSLVSNQVSGVFDTDLDTESISEIEDSDSQLQQLVVASVKPDVESVMKEKKCCITRW